MPPQKKPVKKSLLRSLKEQRGLVLIIAMATIGAGIVISSFAAVPTGISTECQTAVSGTCRKVGKAGGISYWQDNTFADKKVHVLRIDLTNPRYILRASTPNEKGKRPTQFAKDTNSIVAVNGGFFTFGNYQPTGVAAGNGTLWPNTSDAKGPITFLACKYTKECFVDDNYGVATAVDATVYTQIVGGSGILLSKDRGVRWSAQPDSPGCPSKTGNVTCGAALPRTAAGLSADKKSLILVMVEGGQPNLTGLSLYDLTTVLENNGAAYAINLDGGGSSGMVVEGKLVNNRQSNEPNERIVANSFGVVELPPTPSK